MRSTFSEREKGDIAGEIKTIEKDLKKQNDRFRDLIEVNSDFIWEINYDGVYTYASPKSYDVLGYREEEILGKTMFDFMTHEEAERISKIFTKIRYSQRPFLCLEHTNIHKKGYTLTIESSGIPVIDANGKLCGYRGIDRDISRRKRAEFDLRQANYELENVIEECSRELENALTSKEKREEEIEKSKLVLNELNKTLRETNEALCVLARNIDRQKEELENRIQKIVKTKILPIIRQLKSDKKCQKRLAEFEVLEMYITDIIPDSEFFEEINVLLSQQEIRVMALVKDGLASQNIAGILGISLETVKTHRKNIRRKLAIQNTKTNLSSYLKTKFVTLKENE